MRDIKAIWFDLDDTLFDHTYSVCRGLDAVCSTYPALDVLPSDELAVLYNRALNAVYISYLHAEIDFPEMRRRKLKLFYEAVRVNEKELPAMNEFHAIYDEAYNSHRRATPGSIAALERLKENGMPLAILTNGTREGQADKLRRIGLEWMIPSLATSEQAGAPKPDPKIYEWALERSGQTAGNVLMVGDSLENDVEAALRCGLNAILYAPGENQPTITTGHGVAPVIREWKSLFDRLSTTKNPK